VKILKAIAWSAVAIVSILFAIGLMVDGHGKQQDVSETESRSVKDVNIAQLSLEYHRNEVGAEAAYGGRQLRVHSIVDGIHKDGDGKVYLAIDDVIGLGDVRAFLRNSERSKASRLTPMQQVYLVCTGGSLDYAFEVPVLNDCELVNSPGPADLSSDFELGAKLLNEVSGMKDETPKPSSAAHKPAPIIDGPDYLASQAEKELEKDQANSAVGPDTAGQPHDDGNGIAVAPDTAPKP
jgi:tRNA_anti-like